MRRLRIPVLLVVLGLCLLPAALPAQAIKSMLETLGGGAKTTSPELSPAEQLAWTNAQLAAAKGDEKREDEVRKQLLEGGLPESRIEDFRAASRDILRNYQGAADILNAVVKEAETPEASAAGVTPPTSEKQASAMRDSLRRAVIATQAAEGEAELIRRLIAQNQALQANSEREIRQFREEADMAKTPEAKARAESQWDLARLQKSAADSAVFFAKWKCAQQEALAQKASQEADALRSALREGGFDRQLDARRADSQLASIDAESAALEKEIAAASAEQKKAVDQVDALRGKGDSAVDKSRLAAAEQLDSAARGLVSTLQGQAYLLAAEKSHWTAVKSLSGELSQNELRRVTAQAEETISRQTGLGPGVERRLAEAREGLDAAQRQLRAGVSDPLTKSLLEKTVALEQRRVDALGSLVSKSDQIVSTLEEFLSELRIVLGQESAVRKVSRTWGDFVGAISSVWGFELFDIGGNRITIGRLFMAGLGVLLSLLLASWTSRWTSRAATRRFQMAEDQRTLLEKIVFLPVAAVLLVTVLYWLNIPVTMFAFLGGALAIGVGFGAQNLMNNFISGMILLMERQIKVGDIIEVAGSTGKVTHLGSRCSRIRKFDGVELLVPNSAFLEKEVTNWTLADPHHRYDFTLGVAYGSPVDKVIAALNSAIERQPEILRDPAPGVYFEAFGDSSLVFRIYFWIEVGGTVDSSQVGRELRCRIDRDFRAAGIEMPFPQRDIRLRSSSAIPVRIEPPTASPAEPGS